MKKVLPIFGFETDDIREYQTKQEHLIRGISKMPEPHLQTLDEDPFEDVKIIDEIQVHSEDF